METEAIRNLRPMLGAYREAIETALFPILDYIGVPTPPRFDDPHDIISRVFAGLKVNVARIMSPEEVAKIAKQTGITAQALNRVALNTQIRTVLKVNPIMSEPWIIPSLEAFVKESISLITSVPQKNLSDIEQMLYRDAQRKLSPKEMKKRIVEQLDVSEARAELIARDQVGKFNAAITELRQTNLGVASYVWRTSEDERVRPDHARLNGTTQKWAAPPVTVTSGKRAGEHNHPGMDIQCRCYAEPILDKLLGGKVR